MEQQHILVTGAGGYIGRHVVQSLLDAGAAVTAITRRDVGDDLPSAARRVLADVLDPSLDVTTLADRAPDAVVHLAWQNGFAHAEPSHIAHVSDHFRFLNALADWGVQRIAVLGSMHEVGYWEGAIDAETPTNPLSLYGVAKDALRRAATLHLGGARGTTVQWLRCYYIYGDDQRNHSIFTKLLEAAAAGKRTFPFTTGKNRYDFIRVEDLGEQIATCVLRPDVEGVIECCSGEPVSLADQVERFIEEHGLDIELEYGAFPDREYDSPGVWGDASRIRAIMAERA